MTVKEYAEKKKAEMILAGYKNVQIKELIPCELSQSSWSYEPFNRRRIPETAEVQDRPAVINGKIPGVMIEIVFIKPRCRKESRNYFRAALVS